MQEQVPLYREGTPCCPFITRTLDHPIQCIGTNCTLFTGEKCAIVDLADSLDGLGARLISKLSS